MTIVSDLQIAQMMRNAGFPASAIPTGVAIVHAESGANPQAVNHANTNGTQDYGLFQINSVHSQLLQAGNWSNPQSNVNMAYQVWKNAGGKWTPWSTYNSGSYQKFLGAGQAVSGAGPTSSTTTTNASNANLGTGTNATNTNFMQSLGNWMLGQAGIHIPPNLGIRSLWFLLGIALLIVGLIITFRRPITTVSEQGVKAAATAALL